MNAPRSSGEVRVPRKLSQASVEQICQGFQASWQKGMPVSIEASLRRVPVEDQPRLLRGLIITEAGFRLRRGERLYRRKFLQRFPHDPDVVNDAFDWLGLPDSPKKSAPPKDEAGAVKEKPSADPVLRGAYNQSSDIPLLSESDLLPADFDDPPVSRKSKKPAERTPEDLIAEIPIEVVEHGPSRKERKPTGPGPTGNSPPTGKKRSDPLELFDAEILERPPVGKPGSPAKKPGQPGVGTAGGEKQKRSPRPVNRATLTPSDDLIAALDQLEPLSRGPTLPPVRRDNDDEEDAERPKPKKLKKKKKKKKQSWVAAGDSPFEFVVPLSFLIVGMVINVVLAFTLMPSNMGVGLFLAIKVGFVVFSTIVTILALFVAAALLDTSYGYVNTGIVKIAAVCVTQAWIAEIPAAGGIFATLATWGMFLMFFELDFLEVLRSLFVVRLAHWFATTFLLVSVIGFYASGGRTGLEETAAQAIGEQIEAQAEREEGRKRSGVSHEILTEYNTLTRQFGEALLKQDYAAAFELMSSDYRKHTTLNSFKEMHEDARKKYGKPLKIDTGEGTVDREELADEMYGHRGEFPPAQRRAWMNVQLALGVTDGEVDRCYETWILIMDDGGKNRIGRFEYTWCD